MQPELPNDGEAPPPPEARRLWPALTVSVAAHGVILALLLSVKFVGPPLPVTAREYVLVSFARRPEPPPPAPQLEPSQEESTPPASPSPPLTSPSSASPSPSPPSFPRTRESIVADSPDSLDSRIRGNDEAEAPEPQGETPGGEAVDQVALQTQISSFVLQKRDSYTQGFVEDCWIERQEGERRECEGAREGDRGGDAEARAQVTALFQDLTRNTRHARLTAELDARNEQLKELVAAGGVLGALAAERRSIDREYMAYLNGNTNTAASNFVMSISANTGNPQAMSGFLQFICKERPCIYEFTGFSVVKPEAMEEAAAEADTFPYTPTLFGRRK